MAFGFNRRIADEDERKAKLEQALQRRRGLPTSGGMSPPPGAGKLGQLGGDAGAPPGMGKLGRLGAGAPPGGVGPQPGRLMLWDVEGDLARQSLEGTRQMRGIRQRGLDAEAFRGIGNEASEIDRGTEQMLGRARRLQQPDTLSREQQIRLGFSRPGFTPGQVDPRSGFAQEIGRRRAATDQRLRAEGLPEGGMTPEEAQQAMIAADVEPTYVQTPFTGPLGRTARTPEQLDRLQEARAESAAYGQALRESPQELAARRADIQDMNIGRADDQRALREHRENRQMLQRQAQRFGFSGRGQEAAALTSQLAATSPPVTGMARARAQRQQQEAGAQQVAGQRAHELALAKAKRTGAAQRTPEEIAKTRAETEKIMVEAENLRNALPPEDQAELDAMTSSLQELSRNTLLVNDDMLKNARQTMKERLDEIRSRRGDEGARGMGSQQSPIVVSTPEEVAEKVQIGQWFKTPDGRVIQRKQ